MYEMLTDQSNSRSTRMSLPKHVYTDENVYQRDVKWLRENMWWMVGHESQIPNSGDYFLYEFDQDSVIVIRDNEGQIRAHHNVCRHRGSRVCTNAVGTVRALTCPYHAWSYGLDGQLKAAPFTPPDFDRSPYALISCHVRVHCGLIFLSFANSAPDFGIYICFLSRELELQDVQHSKIANRVTLSTKANWKLLAENNLECYHCRPAHPTYAAAHPGASLGRPEDRTNPTRYEQIRAGLRNSSSEKNRQSTPAYTSHDSSHFQLLTRNLIGEDCSTESIGGKPVAPLMAQCTYEGMQTVALPSPLTNAVLNPDYVVIYTFTPRSVQLTDVEVIWLVKETAMEGVDFSVSEVAAVWAQTLLEDKVLVERTQLGIASTAYRPGPYIQTERFVDDFDLWYSKRVLNETPA